MPAPSAELAVKWQFESATAAPSTATKVHRLNVTASIMTLQPLPLHTKMPPAERDAVDQAGAGQADGDSNLHPDLGFSVLTPRR